MGINVSKEPVASIFRPEDSNLHWKFNRKIWQYPLLATVSPDTPSIDVLLHTAALEGHFETTISLNMQAVNAMKSSEKTS
jgi:hypothetical protein